MKSKILAAILLVSVAACGEPPKPAAQAPAPQISLPQPPAPIETKAPEAPKPDPNKELAQRVKRALDGDQRVLSAAIDVTAADGVVTLWGTQPTGPARSLAVEIAGKVAGVKSVNSKLVIVAGS